MHYKLGHHPMGGMFFRNHINLHHAHYSKDHLVSHTHPDNEGHQYALLFHSCVPARTVPVHHLAIQILPCSCCPVRNLVYAHVFSTRNIMWKDPGFGGCMVQAQAGAAFRASSAREQKLCRDPLLLGQSRRNLSGTRIHAVHDGHA